MAKKQFWLNVNFKGRVNGMSWTARAEAALMLIVQTLCSGNDVLVYCAHGKHRTGVVTITTMALLVNPTLSWATALFHAKDVYFANHPNREEHDLEPRVKSIFQSSNFDVWAGGVRHEFLQDNSDYMAFAEVVYGLRSVGPRPPGRGPSSASSSSMPLGPAPSGAGTGSGSMPLGPAPSSASSSSRPPGPAPGAGESDSSPPLPGGQAQAHGHGQAHAQGPPEAGQFVGRGGEAAPGGHRIGGNNSSPGSELRGPGHTRRGQDCWKQQPSSRVGPTVQSRP